MRMFAFVALAVLGLLYFYVARRIITPLRVGKKIKWLGYGWILISCLLSSLPFLLIPYRGSSSWVDLFSKVYYVNFGFFAILFSLLLPIDIIIGIVWLSGKFTEVFTQRKTKEQIETDLQGLRHALRGNRFTRNLALITLVLLLWGMYSALSGPTLKSVEVTVQGLHPDLDGVKILQLSDVHIGDFLKEDFTRNMVQIGMAAQPDLIVITGDLADGKAELLKKDVAPLRELSAPLGKFYVNGNHEYFSDYQGWQALLPQLGFVPLHNAHYPIAIGQANLLLVGVTDPAAQRMEMEGPDFAKAMAGAPAADFTLLLAHQPNLIGEAAKAGMDLQLSGHTHGGQFLPWPLVAFVANSYLDGLHDHLGTMIYVSQGAGFWGPPIRIGTESEITLLTLRAK